MGLVFVVALGVFNFAAHRALIDRGAAMLAQLPRMFQVMGGRLGLLVEFAMLTGAMFMVAAGAIGWAWAYAAYSLANGLAAWVILDRRF